MTVQEFINNLEELSAVQKEYEIDVSDYPTLGPPELKINCAEKTVEIT